MKAAALVVGALALTAALALAIVLHRHRAADPGAVSPDDEAALNTDAARLDNRMDPR